jgi:hypothetical protein
LQTSISFSGFYPLIHVFVKHFLLPLLIRCFWNGNQRVGSSNRERDAKRNPE